MKMSIREQLEKIQSAQVALGEMLDKLYQAIDTDRHTMSLIVGPGPDYPVIINRFGTIESAFEKMTGVKKKFNVGALTPVLETWGHQKRFDVRILGNLAESLKSTSAVPGDFWDMVNLINLFKQDPRFTVCHEDESDLKDSLISLSKEYKLELEKNQQEILDSSCGAIHDDMVKFFCLEREGIPMSTLDDIGEYLRRDMPPLKESDPSLLDKAMIRAINDSPLFLLQNRNVYFRFDKEIESKKKVEISTDDEDWVDWDATWTPEVQVEEKKEDPAPDTSFIPSLILVAHALRDYAISKQPPKFPQEIDYLELFNYLYSSYREHNAGLTSKEIHNLIDSVVNTYPEEFSFSVGDPHCRRRLINILK